MPRNFTSGLFRPYQFGPNLVTPLLTAAIMAVAMTGLPGIAAAHDQGTLSISGTAQVSAVPDLATISMGVVSQAPTAAQALAQNNAQLAGVLAVLDANGIEDRDRQTSGLSVQPNWVYPRQNDGNTPPRITGYTVSNQLSVRIRNLDRLGAILDAVVRDGANQYQGLSFGVTDPAPLIDAARQAAAADALRKAQLYAQALGVALGDIQSFSESGGTPQPMMMRAEAMMVADAPGSVPVANGEVSFSSTVNITWTLDQ